MEYNENNGRVMMTTIPTSPLSKQLLITTDPEIGRIRKIVLVFCGICLALCINGLIYSLFFDMIQYSPITNGRLKEFGE
ncbi:unnamed protein product [Rotaria sp. Silwood1]|nr:unnamed protein product [Rotaria sp. Silwood1]CAF1578736.1 unnamed protein product [Rotaria sp. Silwood1]